MITKADYDELKMYDCLGIPWAARTTGGDLYVSVEKPKKINGRFTVSYNALTKLVRSDLLPNVKATDKKPYNIAAAIAEYEREKEIDNDH